MDEKKTKITGVVDFSQNIQSELRANVLCNYMQKQEYLDLILRNQAIVPRYVIEPLDYLALGNVKRICFPMTCFCDIPFSKVSTHMSHYGEYGIGLDKEVTKNKHGIQPIHYINEKSPLCNDFCHVFKKFYNSEPMIDTPEETLLDYLLTTLLYMKPIQGWEKDKNGDLEQRIYQDECEWRFIPQNPFSSGLPFILPQEETNDRARNIYSDALLEHEEYWLRFSWEDVRYIIVPNEDAVRKTITSIRGLDIDIADMDLLISKIEVSKRFGENM